MVELSLCLRLMLHLVVRVDDGLVRHGFDLQRLHVDGYLSWKASTGAERNRKQAAQVRRQLTQHARMRVHEAALVAVPFFLALNTLVVIRSSTPTARTSIVFGIPCYVQIASVRTRC